MKRQTWVIIFVIIVIVIGLLLFMAFRQPQDKNKKREMCPDGKTPIPSNGQCPTNSVGTNAVPDETGCIQPSSYSSYSYPIKKGMQNGVSGKAVSELQKKLNFKYNAGLREDGFFGCLTEKASMKYLGTTQIYTTNPIWAVQIPQPFLG